ncbi:sensor histidine kinase [Streptomyces sp. NPDC004111]|uniref:sensor histidine kinase n=1 Tax=Streptomyces sp. NPDC004111 TaxID=3364690 RepID=UPI0036B21B11
MAVALAAVATTTRSLLLRDVDSRIGQLLTQETREFANFVAQGVDPDTGGRFTDTHRLLEVFLQRQYSDPDEELLGLLRTDGPRPRVVRQPRDFPPGTALHQDSGALIEIFGSGAASGTLERGDGAGRSGGAVAWAKVPIAGPTQGAFVVVVHTERERAVADKTFRILLAISGVALLMSTGIGWAVAGRILAPVRLVRTTAAQLTEQDLTRRIPVEGRDDIAALAATFNAMLDRLERAFAAQREFVDDAGHELRTPITIVRGHLELMGEDPAEREETLRLVTDELDRMSRMVEDLLLLAKAERPDFVTPEPVQLAELTADVFVKARTLGDRDWVLAEVADREVRLDPQRITQAMVQLAQNAVQHTARGSRVAIGSRTRTPPGGQEQAAPIELYVSDSGPGVPPRDAAVIFERFRRGSARRGSRSTGAGLGLAIVKAIAEGHRGRVELSAGTAGPEYGGAAGPEYGGSPVAGPGATFTLVLDPGPATAVPEGTPPAS